MTAVEKRQRENNTIQRENAIYAPLLTVGAAVEVIKDDGSMVPSRVRQAPWQTGAGDWLVSVDGIAGGYAVERVRLLDEVRRDQEDPFN